jgi:hypothetical protein
MPQIHKSIIQTSRTLTTYIISALTKEIVSFNSANLLYVSSISPRSRTRFSQLRFVHWYDPYFEDLTHSGHKSIFTTLSSLQQGVSNHVRGCYTNFSRSVIEIFIVTPVSYSLQITPYCGFRLRTIYARNKRLGTSVTKKYFVKR